MKNRYIWLLLLLLTTVAVPAQAMTSLQQVCRQKAEAQAAGGAVQGVDGWLFLQEELVHVGAGKFWGENAAKASRTSKKDNADPVPAIIEYQQNLAERGIELYLMPVPPKVLIYPQKLSAEIGDISEDIALYESFYQVLQDKGVKVIDLIEPLKTAVSTGKQVYCRTDTHFSGQGLGLFAKAAAGVIKKEPWYEAVPKRNFVTAQRSVSISGDLARMAGNSASLEDVEISVVTDSATGQAVASDENSPVVLLGDSHTLVFNAGGDLHAAGAGLFDNLSAELGFAVDLLGVRGSGVTPARIKFYQRSKQNSDYLTNKKVVIWCFSAREFTGTGGWRSIPPAP